MKRTILGAMAVVVVMGLVAGIVSAVTVRTDALEHQGIYDMSSSHAGTNTTKTVSGHSAEHDVRSIITSACLFVILIGIIAIAMYRTRGRT
jgi:hypothetical protein